MIWCNYVWQALVSSIGEKGCTASRDRTVNSAYTVVYMGFDDWDCRAVVMEVDIR